ncbi:MAG TPA: transporter, partial [Porphyromonadaceae bacterium]|nr:transporter [Porphyromonadaceae bacterium]
VSIEQAWANRPEVKMLAQAGNIAEANKKMMVSRFMPTVALTGGYVTTNPNVFNGYEKKFNGMFTVGVTAVVPLFHFGEKIHTLNASRAQAVVAKLQLEEAKEKIELQIHQDTYRIGESLKKQEMTRKNVEKAQENLMYAQEGFDAGVITSTDLLMAQTAWLSARSEYIDATVDVKLNNVYLKKSTGTLYQE